MSIPTNPRHGRQATEKERKALIALGLPKHALCHQIDLKMSSSEKNPGKWYWTWGKAFLGFCGQINKDKLDAKWRHGDLVPFPTRESRRAQLGYEERDFDVEFETEEKDPNEENVPPPQTPLKTKPFLTKKEPTVVVKRKIDFHQKEDDALTTTEEENEPVEPPAKKRKVLNKDNE